MQYTVASKAEGFPVRTEDGDRLTMLAGAGGGADDALIALFFMFAYISSTTIFADGFTRTMLADEAAFALCALVL
jgi:hypothetical protein